MRSLTRFGSPPDRGGDELRLNFPELQRLGVGIRTAEVSMVAGPPGAGKSTLAMSLALRSFEPTLYICSDTSEHTIRVRTAAMLTGDTQQEVETRMQEDTEYAKEVQAGGEYIHWVFPDAPTLDAIEQEIWAYEEVMGQDPRLIVIDNLLDVSTEGGQDEWAALRTAMKGVKHLAKMTRAAILVLHHTSEGVSHDYAPPMRSIQGKVSQLPALILTVGQDVTVGEMYVASVKNRYGKADPHATTYTAIPFDGERMQLGGRR